MSIKTEDISCPTCGKKNTWTPNNAFKPFCSDRCKLIDLGAWASEKNKVAGEPVDPEQLTDGGDDSE
jgi:uncharacterized protein